MGIRKDDDEATSAWWSAWRPAASPPAHALCCTAFTEEVAKRNLQNVTVAQTGCIGICQYEPVVEIMEPGKEKVTYVKMTPEKAAARWSTTIWSTATSVDRIHHRRRCA